MLGHVTKRFSGSTLPENVPVSFYNFSDGSLVHWGGLTHEAC